MARNFSARSYCDTGARLIRHVWAGNIRNKNKQKAAKFSRSRTAYMGDVNMQHQNYDIRRDTPSSERVNAADMVVLTPQGARNAERMRCRSWVLRSQPSMRRAIRRNEQKRRKLIGVGHQRTTGEITVSVYRQLGCYWPHDRSGKVHVRSK